MNRWNSESHQARLNGRVVTDEDVIKVLNVGYVGKEENV